MEILPKIEIIGLTLYIKKEKTLVISDLHLGLEEALSVPKFQFSKIVDHLDKVFSMTDVDRIVINGDLKHEFGHISEQEWSEVTRILDYLDKKCKELILIKGNHDTILGPIAKRKNIVVHDHIFLDKNKIYITHGHQILEDKEFKNSDIVIIAHEHPAIGLREEFRTEKVKCFLKGLWNNKILIVQPSLNFVTEGTDITQETMLSPFLKQDLSEFEIYAVEGFEVMRFGRLGDIIY